LPTDADADSSYYRWDKTSLLLSCFIQPRASKDEIVGPHDQRLKIRLTSSPVDGMANTQLIVFLAKQFGVAKNKVELVSGESSRRKILQIDAPTKFPERAAILPLKLTSQA
jgi:uncharacterized protein